MSLHMTASASPSSPLGRRRRLNLEGKGFIGEGTVGRVILCSEAVRGTPHGSRRGRLAGSHPKLWAVKFAEREKLQQKQSSLTIERRILQRVRHRNVLKMEWFADVGDISVLGLEFCAGGDLFGLLYEKLGGPLCEAEIRPLAAQIYRGIRALHRHGVVHRDLKLENIGLTLQGEIKLLDFDSAFMFESEEQTVVTQCGTLAYASPEVLCRKEARFEPDFWSFGIVLYELLCASTPFEAADDSEDCDSECVRRICTVQHRYPHSVTRTLLTTVIDALLEKQQVVRMNALSLESHPWFADLVNSNDFLPGCNGDVDQIEELTALGVSEDDAELPTPFQNSFEATFVV